MVHNNDLFISSLSNLSSGPPYTYFREDTQTTTNYTIIDARHAPLAIRCETYDHHPLNFSSHLPLSLTLSLKPTADPTTTCSQPRLNWWGAVEDRSIEACVSAMDAIIRPHFGKSYNLISSLDEEVHLMSASVLQAASSTIPTHKPKRSKSISPEILS